MSSPLHIIYIPGLGDEQEPKGQIKAVRRWQRYDVEAEVFRMYWGDGKAWLTKFNRLLARIDELSADGRTLALVGASAGASVAINAFAARKNSVAGVVLIAGKVNRPEAIHTSHYSKNPALPASVKQAVSSLAELSVKDRSRILSRYGIFDERVTRADSLVPGAHNQQVPTAGHFFNIALQLIFGAPSFIKFLKRQAAD